MVNYKTRASNLIWSLSSQVAASDELIYVQDMNTEWTYIFLFAWHDYDFLQKDQKRHCRPCLWVGWLRSLLHLRRVRINRAMTSHDYPTVPCTNRFPHAGAGWSERKLVGLAGMLSDFWNSGMLVFSVKYKMTAHSHDWIHFETAIQGCDAVHLAGNIQLLGCTFQPSTTSGAFANSSTMKAPFVLCWRV